MFKAPLTNNTANISFSFDQTVFSDIVKPAAVEFQRRSALDRGEGDSPVGAGDAEEASHRSNHRNSPHSRIDLTLSSRTGGLKTFSQ